MNILDEARDDVADYRSQVEAKRERGEVLDENDLLVLGELSTDPMVGTRLVNGSRHRPKPPRFDRGDHAEIADALLAELGHHSRIVSVGNAMHVYADTAGIWEARPRDELRRIVKGFAGAPKGDKGRLTVSSGAVEGAINLAHAEASFPGFFDDAPAGVAMRNVFVGVDGGRVVLHDHSPGHRARFGHRLEYRADAPRGELEALLEQVFSDVSEDERAARIACLQEHVGACLTGIATKYDKCLLLVGGGGNGKSTLAEVLYRGALPDGTIASLAPQLWGERFQLARLLGALANVCDELPESEILKTGVFKSAVAGEPVHIEQKNRDPFDARLRCGHVFCANQLPTTKDLTEGFFRRFIVIEFGRRFDNMSTCDPDLAEKVIRKCRPGIVAFALEGAARLQRQGRYTVPPSADETLAEWKRSSDSTALFCEARTRVVDANELGAAARHLYGQYKAWALANGHHAVSSRTFAERMRAAGKGPSRSASGNRYPVVMLDDDDGHGSV